MEKCDALEEIKLLLLQQMRLSSLKAHLHKLSSTQAYATVTLV